MQNKGFKCCFFSRFFNRCFQLTWLGTCNWKPSEYNNPVVYRIGVYLPRACSPYPDMLVENSQKNIETSACPYFFPNFFLPHKCLNQTYYRLIISYIWFFLATGIYKLWYVNASMSLFMFHSYKHTIIHTSMKKNLP